MHKSELAGLEYPRYLHKPGGESCLVANLAAAEEAVKDGWSADPQVSVLPKGSAIPHRGPVTDAKDTSKDKK